MISEKVFSNFAIKYFLQNKFLKVVKYIVHPTGYQSVRQLQQIHFTVVIYLFLISDD